MRNGWRGARPLRRWLALSLMVRRVDGSDNELVDVVAHCSVAEEDCWAAGVPLATRHRCPLLPVKEWSYQWCVEADSPVRLLWHLRGHPPVVIVLLWSEKWSPSQTPSRGKRGMGGGHYGVDVHHGDEALK
jgi:hypothetical protein